MSTINYSVFLIINSLTLIEYNKNKLSFKSIINVEYQHEIMYKLFLLIYIIYIDTFSNFSFLYFSKIL